VLKQAKDKEMLLFDEQQHFLLSIRSSRF
jgi:hypothetical protein